nr:MAG TPA: hypothetical protein [Caudoviricetes sp.]
MNLWKITKYKWHPPGCFYNAKKQEVSLSD